MPEEDVVEATDIPREVDVLMETLIVIDDDLWEVRRDIRKIEQAVDEMSASEAAIDDCDSAEIVAQSLGKLRVERPVDDVAPHIASRKHAAEVRLTQLREHEARLEVAFEHVRAQVDELVEDL